VQVLRQRLDDGRRTWHGKDFFPAVPSVDLLQPRGAIWRNDWNRYVWHLALKAAGVTPSRDNRFHQLRHHYASVLLADGVDIRALAEYLGHSDPGFTLRVYTHLMPSAPERARDAIDRAFRARPDCPGVAQGGETGS